MRDKPHGGGQIIAIESTWQAVEVTYSPWTRGNSELFIVKLVSIIPYTSLHTTREIEIYNIHVQNVK